MNKGWFGLAALAAVLHAQPGEIRLRLLDGGVYRDRELVRVELSEPGREWQFSGFLVEPEPECGSMAKPCTLSGMQFAEMGPMGPSPNRILAINHYAPRLAPGSYQVRALLRRTNGGRYTEPAEYTTTGAVVFQVVASNPEWVGQTVAKCTAVLRNGKDEGWQAAAQQLAWLDTAASREAALELLPKEEGLLLAGLRATREPARLCERMQARVSLPGQSVSAQFLETVSGVCGDANLPPAPASKGGPRLAQAVISTTAPKPMVVAPIDPAVQAYWEKRRAYTENLWNRVTASLVASLPGKETEPRWSAFATLLQYVNQARSDHPAQPDPAWIPALTAEFARSFAEIEEGRKQYLLEMFTSTIRSPSIVPLLESVLDSWRPGNSYQAVHSAIRALNGIDPARAQARLRAELTRSETWLDVQQLDLLPASAVPPMDEALLEAAAEAQRPPGWNPPLRMAALARYGTTAALARVRALFESLQSGCQPELLAYLVRVDPAYADRVFHRHPWDMHAMPPPCTIQYFERTPNLATSPELEQYLAAYLMHSDVHIKTIAARALGRYGTAAAVPKLWGTLRYFREWWKGKAAELEKNGEGIALEVEVRNALARGRGWLATEVELRQIAALCSSQWCAGETGADLRQWEGPVRVQVSEGRNRVAQYGNLETLADLEAKLRQFPAGTRFVVSGAGPDADEIRRFLGQ